MYMKRVTVRLPKQHLDMIDTLVNLGEFSSRSAVFRAAVRDLIYQRSDHLLEMAERMEKMRQVAEQMKALERYTKR